MNPQSSSGERRKSELQEIRRELRDKQNLVSDDNEELWRDISEWLLQSHNTPVGSLRTKIRSALAALQDESEHKMYDHPEVDDGTEAFPDRCKGCPHYGVQCPVLARHISKQTLDRIYDEAEDDDELQGQLSRYAAKNNCHVIQEEIEEWETGYSAFLSRGERLRLELNADIKGMDLSALDSRVHGGLDGDTVGEDDEEPRGPPAAMSTTGESRSGDRNDAGSVAGEEPPEEARKRMAAVSESLMADDEEDAES